MAISSHGERFPNDSQLRNCDSVVGVDGKSVDFYTLTSYFTEEMCPTLKGKPKLFFIQVRFISLLYTGKPTSLYWDGPQVSRAGTSNYIPQILRLPQHSSYALQTLDILLSHITRYIIIENGFTKKVGKAILVFSLVRFRNNKMCSMSPLTGE